jgi:hypothetical protein
MSTDLEVAWQGMWGSEVNYFFKIRPLLDMNHTIMNIKAFGKFLKKTYILPLSEVP